MADASFYRDILKAYMRHVLEAEGVTYVTDGAGLFTFLEDTLTTDQYRVIKEIEQEMLSERKRFDAIIIRESPPSR